jgi:hypothetical protein
MKRRRRKPPDLLELFEKTCGWCGKTILANTPVFGGGGKARPGVDLSDKAGKVMPIDLIRARKTVLIAVTAPDSDARRDGHDFVYLTCSADCALRMRAAFQDDIESGKRLRGE